MGFINFRGGQKADNFNELSEEAKRAEAVEQELVGSKHRREIAAGFFGVPELAEKENSVVLANLVAQKNALMAIHDSLCEGNALFSYFDDTQLMNDFWLASVVDILDQSSLNDNQKAKCLQLMLTVFKVNNLTNGNQHYLFISKNENYRAYLQRCFDLSGAGMPYVWIWFEHLGNQPLPGVGKHSINRMDSVIYFMQEYMKFMMGLSFYLSQIFPGRGCGKNIRQSLANKLEIISVEMTRQDYLELDISLLVNPVHFNPEDFRSNYEGFEQTANQSEGLKGAFNNLREAFGKPKRILQLVQLLDLCSDSEKGLLEKEYKRTSSSF